MGQDLELYDKVFEAFGVSAMQFNALVSSGRRCRASPGGIVVKAGVGYVKVALIVSGEAIQFKHAPWMSITERGEPVWRYTGKLPGAEPCGPFEEFYKNEALPMRGSVIGGAALAEEDCEPEDYPGDIIATSHLDWIEWDVETLKRTIEAPRWRSVQACFYWTLYADLLSMLDEHKSTKILTKEKPAEVDAPQPHTRQLLALSAFVAVPFFGFGFADNFIMIIAGDAIDAQFGMKLGLTTLAAAGLGNWISDVAGLGLGDVIERQAVRIGLSDGQLTPGQQNLRITKLITLGAKVVGLSLGCFAGMLPLFFLTPTKVEFAAEDLELYDQVFRPFGVSTQQFADLMERGTKRWGRAGETVIHGGKEFNKVFLLLRGETESFAHVEGKRPKAHCYYTGRLDGRRERTETARSILGGTALADASRLGTPYPNDVVASSAVEFIEWNVKDLIGLMHQEKAIHASFYSMLYTELIQNLDKDFQRKQLEQYNMLVSAVILDGAVTKQERDFIEDHKRTLRITDEEHLAVLHDLGWTQESWERGTMQQSTGALVRAVSMRQLRNTSECSLQLQRAVALIEGVTQQLGKVQ